jgi:hypothetical protein
MEHNEDFKVCKGFWGQNNFAIKFEYVFAGFGIQSISNVPVTL